MQLLQVWWQHWQLLNVLAVDAQACQVPASIKVGMLELQFCRHCLNMQNMLVVSRC
jgi:hypothetical protein